MGAARVTLKFNLSDDVACAMEMAAAMVLLWLICNSSHGRQPPTPSLEQGLHSRPSAEHGLRERQAVETQRG